MTEVTVTNYALIIDGPDGQSICGGTFFAHTDDCAAKIARAMVRFWATATKNNEVPVTRDMVRMVRRSVDTRPTKK